jgi:uncharacterized protein YtpQ (UPF0354 family)
VDPKGQEPKTSSRSDGVERNIRFESRRLALIYQWPGSIQYITQDHLQEWGVTFAEAVEAARGNLAQRQRPFEPSTAQGLHISRTDDSLGASGLLLLDAIRGLKVSGNVVATVPNQSMLLVAGSEDSAALAAMAKMTEKGLRQRP